MLDFIAGQPHYLDHLLPVWNATPAECRGRFLTVGHDTARALAARGIQPSDDYNNRQRARVVVAAGMADLRSVSYDRRVLLEHGAGQSYVDSTSPGYAGAEYRELVDLFLHPNAIAAGADELRYPGRTEVVGWPWLEALADLLRGEPTGTTIASTWHWPCEISPEAGTAWFEYRKAMAAVPGRQIASAHPRLYPELERWHVSQGEKQACIPWFPFLLNQAALLVADNTSAMYAWAALTDRPVVVVNRSDWRRDINHGMRFWDWVPGIQVDRPSDLAAAIALELEHDTGAELRRAAVAAVVGEVAGSAERAAAILVSDARLW